MSEHVANGCRCEEPPEPQPLDLDKLQIAHDVYRRDGEEGNGPQAQTYLLDAVPGLLDELREARAELDDWRNREHEQEYVLVGPGGDPNDADLVSQRAADLALERPELVTPWVRTVTTSEWERHISAPF
ncbi:hypothetical protein [Microbispora rosea]|uniref:hypothetical protein n=1 Tax=Microbispora rosea TaxID=58117 RepID=UPI0004C45841|nr:hypothetical protein [Microbispora rosea]